MAGLVQAILRGWRIERAVSNGGQKPSHLQALAAGPPMSDLDLRHCGVDGRDKPTAVRHGLCFSCRLLHDEASPLGSALVRLSGRAGVEDEIGWRGSSPGGEGLRSSSPMGRRSMILVLISRAKVSGLSTTPLAS